MFSHRLVTRPTAARTIREQATELAARTPPRDHLSNGEELEYRRPLPPLDNGDLSYIANYSKGLPHNALGEVNQTAYRSLLRAFYSGDPDHFEQILLDFGLAGTRRLTNPQAGLAFDLEGPDAQAVTMPPAPRIDSPQNSAEMAELYWMVVCRDVNFNDYSIDPLVASAAQSLSAPSAGGEFTDFRGPKVGALVTPATIFRGVTRGDLAGPYVSQFLLKPIPYGTLEISQQQKSGPAGDFLTTFPAWLATQNGFNTIVPTPTGPNRFISTLRDLANYVHFDALYEAYLNACLILLGMRARFDPGNPYVRSRTQEGFGTFGPPHILSLVTEVATRALKAVWFQKWGVHRRLRPEEFGGRLHVHIQGVGATPPGRYPMIDGEIVASLTGGMLSPHFPAAGTYLLPQAFQEGAPTHPAYGAGHATVAGACVTILKAWFDESFVLPNPEVPDPTTGSTSLIPAPAGTPPLTVGGELNKLAANISLGRNAAGVHWRSDYTESIKLGEEIAIGILREQRLTYNEDHYLSLTRFDGTAITV
ncbi:MAG: vanadium-dependent haloperoxidase [Chloroflexota bacterium]|nr:vanadium-dependent haloperoxidase [Chloroflexota bacterium]